MAEAVYVLCFATSVACAVLLFRQFGRTRVRLLFWSGLCFAGLAANNLLLFLDKAVITTADLQLWRAGAALAGIVVLIYGLTHDSE